MNDLTWQEPVEYNKNIINNKHSKSSLVTTQGLHMRFYFYEYLIIGN